MPETSAPSPNAAQIEHWNVQAGPTWAKFQVQLDRTVEPLGLEAIRALAPGPGERVMDIGCGGGQTTLELAARVGASGAVTGIDISAPMLEVALRRVAPAGAAQPEFRQIDAQTGDLGDAAFDAAFSRFGIMFFSDPAAAFGNIRRALKSDGRLAFVCWRPYPENLWMRLPLEAALPFLPPMPPPGDPTAPGPFAFANPDRIRAILGAGGFQAVTIDVAGRSPRRRAARVSRTRGRYRRRRPGRSRPPRNAARRPHAGRRLDRSGASRLMSPG
jgi:SAM-dependent methyltransferase